MQEQSSQAKSIPVKIHIATYNRVKLYADMRNQPFVRALDEIINDWMDTVGDTRIEYWAKMTSENRVAQPRIVWDDPADFDPQVPPSSPVAQA